MPAKSKTNECSEYKASADCRAAGADKGLFCWWNYDDTNCDQLTEKEFTSRIEDKRKARKKALTKDPKDPKYKRKRKSRKRKSKKHKDKKEHHEQTGGMGKNDKVIIKEGPYKGKKGVIMAEGIIDGKKQYFIKSDEQIFENNKLGQYFLESELTKIGEVEPYARRHPIETGVSTAGVACKNTAECDTGEECKKDFDGLMRCIPEGYDPTKAYHDKDVPAPYNTRPKKTSAEDNYNHHVMQSVKWMTGVLGRKSPVHAKYELLAAEKFIPGLPKDIDDRVGDWGEFGHGQSPEKIEEWYNLRKKELENVKIPDGFDPRKASTTKKEQLKDMASQTSTTRFELVVCLLDAYKNLAPQSRFETKTPYNYLQFLNTHLFQFLANKVDTPKLKKLFHSTPEENIVTILQPDNPTGPYNVNTDLIFDFVSSDACCNMDDLMVGTMPIKHKMSKVKTQWYDYYTGRALRDLILNMYVSHYPPNVYGMKDPYNYYRVLKDNLFDFMQNQEHDIVLMQLFDQDPVKSIKAFLEPEARSGFVVPDEVFVDFGRSPHFLNTNKLSRAVMYGGGSHKRELRAHDLVLKNARTTLLTRLANSIGLRQGIKAAYRKAYPIKKNPFGSELYFYNQLEKNLEDFMGEKDMTLHNYNENMRDLIGDDPVANVDFILEPTRLTNRYNMPNSEAKSFIKSNQFMNFANVQGEFMDINNILSGGKRRTKSHHGGYHIDSGFRGIGVRQDKRGNPVFVNMKTNHPIKEGGPTWNKIVRNQISPFQVDRHRIHLPLLTSSDIVHHPYLTIEDAYTKLYPFNNPTDRLYWKKIFLHNYKTAIFDQSFPAGARRPKSDYETIYFNFNNPDASVRAILNANNNNNADPIVRRLFGSNALSSLTHSRSFLRPVVNDGLHPWHNVLARHNALGLTNMNLYSDSVINSANLFHERLPLIPQFI